MNESEWLTCSDPRRMLDFIRAGASFWRRLLGKVSPISRLSRRAIERKCRLVACAIGRLVCTRAADFALRTISVSELYADEVIGEDELRAAQDTAYAAVDPDSAYDPFLGDQPDDPLPEDRVILRIVGNNPLDDLGAVLTGRHEGAVFCELFREVFGNPFRPTLVESRWQTPTVLALTRTTYGERRWEEKHISVIPVVPLASWLPPEGMGMAARVKTGYDELRFNELPILADAIEEAGCGDPAILDHCRQPGRHVRGCWVLDLLLNRG